MRKGRITLLAFGSVGDVVPYLALANGLETAGHDVTFVSPRKFTNLARHHVSNFRPVDEDPQAVLSSPTGQEWLASSYNLPKLIAATRKIMEHNLPRYAAHALRESKGADVIVSTNLASLVAAHAAESVGAVHIPAYPMPVTPTAAIPSAMVPLPVSFGNRAANWLSHRLYYIACSLLMNSLANRLRREIFGLRATIAVEPFRSIRNQTVPMLYCYSSAVLPRPPKWKSCTCVSGYWFLPAIPEWKLPSGLDQFIDAGPPPVCISFGSMVDREPERTAEIVIESLRRAGCRGVIVSGWSGVKAVAPSDAIFVIDAVDHGLLFPRMAAIVHHGGAGGTAAALRAGIPAVPVPFFADQFFWAKAIDRLGVSPASVPRKDLSVDSLSKAITEALGNHSYRERARVVAEKLRTEDGVGNAVRFIEQYLPA
ncbi:MAG TPA: glycosyltransferase [Candidatus Binataceae bacterium]|nr:glycosyltransferase [Candidatus Binataceae bacterium]